MKQPRPALPAVFRHRWRRDNEPRPASLFALAAVLLVAVTAAASVLPAWTPQAPDVVPASLAPQQASPTHARTGAEELTPAAERLASFVARHYRVARESSRDMVRTAFREGRRNDIDPLLILAVIAVESRFNPIAESEQGAVGLMQIVPRFHMDKVNTGVDAGANAAGPSFLPPHANIAIGARILKDSIRRGGGEVAGLQLYNGSFDDDSRAYANRVQVERRRLETALPRVRSRA
jgi:soluble lytic murein transglycosylase-like protein